jgi:hypothetical protein
MMMGWSARSALHAARAVSPMRRVWLAAGLVAVVAALTVSVGFTVAQGRTPRPAGTTGVMGGTGMMGAVWLAGNGVRVTSIPVARDRAAVAAAQGLHPGEVIWFDNGFYVELKDATGDSATEVIVDPAGGAVRTEPGPAMMWNTRYGMPGAVTRASGRNAVSAARAQQLASAWLAANLPGHAAEPPDAYPGYYTMETTTGGAVDGMLSVNATTGQVWYHSWHGRYIAREDG